MGPRAASLALEASRARVTLGAKRAFLASGAAWPGEPPPDCVETHASYVFLTRDRAWKLKKPVRLTHIDMRGIEARERLCREELRLNRELSGSVYRGVVPLVRRVDGALAIGDAAEGGEVVDWLVETVRLPATEFLDRRLHDGRPPRLGEIRAASERLISFYRDRPTIPEAGDIYLDRLYREARINAVHLREMRDHIGAPLSDVLVDRAIGMLDDHRAEILDRAARGGVIEGHGDLRAEHVCLTRPPVIFDRVEFDMGIRLIDPWDEFNTLGIDCGLMGGVWIRAILLFQLAHAGIVPPSPGLLAAYGVNQCLTRARLAIDHMRDAEVRTPEKWPRRTRLFLAAAEGFLANGRKMDRLFGKGRD